MKWTRILGSVGLAFSLAGCTGTTRQNLVADSLTGDPTTMTGLVAWQNPRGSALSDEAVARTVATDGSDAPQAVSTPAPVDTPTGYFPAPPPGAPATAPPTAVPAGNHTHPIPPKPTAIPSPNMVSEGVSRYFPMFRRSAPTASDMGQPVGNDDWAETMRRGMIERAERQKREREAQQQPVPGMVIDRPAQGRPRLMRAVPRSRPVTAPDPEPIQPAPADEAPLVSNDAPEAVVENEAPSLPVAPRTYDAPAVERTAARGEPVAIPALEAEVPAAPAARTVLALDDTDTTPPPPAAPATDGEAAPPAPNAGVESAPTLPDTRIEEAPPAAKPAAEPVPAEPTKPAEETKPAEPTKPVEEAPSSDLKAPETPAPTAPTEEVPSAPPLSFPPAAAEPQAPASPAPQSGPATFEPLPSTLDILSSAPSSQAPSKVAPAPQAPTKVAPTAQAPTKAAPNKVLPTGQAAMAPTRSVPGSAALAPSKVLPAGQASPQAALKTLPAGRAPSAPTKSRPAMAHQPSQPSKSLPAHSGYVPGWKVPLSAKLSRMTGFFHGGGPAPAAASKTLPTPQLTSKLVPVPAAPPMTMPVPAGASPYSPPVPSDEAPAAPSMPVAPSPAPDAEEPVPAPPPAESMPEAEKAPAPEPTPEPVPVPAPENAPEPPPAAVTEPPPAAVTEAPKPPAETVAPRPPAETVAPRPPAETDTPPPPPPARGREQIKMSWFRSKIKQVMNFPRDTAIIPSSGDMPLFPSTYYRNPGADASVTHQALVNSYAQGVREAVSVDPGPAARQFVPVPSSTAAPTPETTTAPASAPALTQTSSTPRPSFWSRMVARFQGYEEIAVHPYNCKCGRHPRSEVPPAPPRRELVGTEPGDLPQAGDLLNRIATNRFDEATER